MAVIVKYIVVRNGVEKMTFATKKEADAHDKMLDIADNLYEFLETMNIGLDETQIENISLVFAKNRIGEGAEELGKMLVSGFLNTFKEMEKLPQKVIFLNSGIDLVLKDSPTIPILKEYEAQGVELLACGACLDFYKKVDEVAVGRVSNAYDILNATINTGKVISF